MTLNATQVERVLDTYRTTGSKREAVWRVGPARRPHARAMLEELEASEGPVEEVKKPYIGGRVEAPPPRQAERTRSGVDYFLCSTVQNNTLLHEPAWNAMRAFADHLGATMLLSRCMYDTSVQSRLVKERRETSKDIWFDDRITPHLADVDLQLADGLVWKGSMNIIPTVRNPLAGLEGIGRGASAVIPHVQVAMESIGRMHVDAPVHNYTTGALTQNHYLMRREGQIGQFHHSYGGLLLGILPDDTWFARQVLVDRDGVLCDLSTRVDARGRVSRAPVLSVSLGDLHLDEVDTTALAAARALLRDTEPALVCLHDAMSMARRSHHHGPMDLYKGFLAGKDVRAGGATGPRSFLRDVSPRKPLRARGEQSFRGPPQPVA